MTENVIAPAVNCDSASVKNCSSGGNRAARLSTIWRTRSGSFRRMPSSEMRSRIAGRIANSELNATPDASSPPPAAP